MKRLFCVLLLLAWLFSPLVAGGEDETDIMLDEDPAETEAAPDIPESADDEPAAEPTARDSFIEDIIALGKKLYEKADGKAQRAHYKGDIYVCKNFTVYLFRQTRDRYRMAEFPDVQLVIPDNLPAKECKPYAYGFLWKEIPAEKGNPFYEAAQFRYDTKLSKEENLELAVDFMKQVKKGDYFQMSADYAYGVGAHSAIMISDYDPETNTVHWMDSNMRGKKRNGIRYGIVQFNEEKDITWWAKAFCHKKRGATLYRLRDDIIFAD